MQRILNEYNRLCKLENRKGQIYRDFKKIINTHTIAIEKNFPKVMRRVRGYNLDEFIHTEDWNLAKLIVGIEGTLAIIL